MCMTWKPDYVNLFLIKYKNFLNYIPDILIYAITFEPLDYST